MKRILLLTAMLLVILTASAQYVDLGLPSGTQWKQTNEIGYYTYDGAMTEFGSQLPTVTQQDELREYCTWTWMGSGYKVIGPNGNFIYLPAAGGRNCNGNVYYVGSYGSYCSSTPYGSGGVYYLNFNSDRVDIGINDRCFGRSVRLIKAIQPSTEEAFKAELKLIVEDEDMMEIYQEEPPKLELPPLPQEKILSDVIEVQDNDAEVEEIEFNSEDDEDSMVHIVVEKMPEFPGGAAAMNNFIVSNLRYPLLAQENGIEGRVICQFVVNTDGSIVDIKVARGVEASLEAEAVRLVKSMPKWTPGRHGGKVVRCRYTLPIRFKLQRGEEVSN